MKKMTTSPKALSLALVACIAVTGCTKPRQTTGIGSAAGGAIGAGLGAIIGNQTGSTGGGIAIGAVAGAATGALVGNALQSQQEKTQSQNEAIARQEKAIRAQRSEIDELRRMQSDSGNSYGQARTVNAYLVEQKRLQLQRRGPAPRGESNQGRYTPPPLSARASEPLARYEMKTNTAAKKVTPPMPQAAPPKTTNILTRTTASGVKERDLASESVANIETDEAPVKHEETPPQKNEAIIEKDVAPAKKEDTTAKVAPAAQQQTGCEESKKDRDAAAAASEGSDKLFYLRRALRVCPNSAETHVELGKAYLMMDRASDASYEFKQALSIDPTSKAAKESLDELDQGKERF